MNVELPPRIVLKYYLYKSTKAVGFYRPIMILFLTAKGLSFTQVATIEGLYALATVVGEVPTGYVGDRIGRKNSLVVGTAIIAGSLVAIGLSDSFLVLAALWVTWSMGYNFRSGSADAWLYDMLEERFSSERFAHVRGRGTSAALLVGAAGSILGGYISEYSLAYPFFIAAGVTALGIVFLLTLPKSEQYEESDDDPLSFRRALSIVGETLSSRSLRAFVVYYFVIFTTVITLVVLYMQPVTKDVIVTVGISADTVEPLLGWMYALFAVLSAGLSYKTGWVKEVVGIKRWFLVLPFVVGAGLVVAFAVPILVIPTMILARSVFDTTRSLARQYVNDNTESIGRATVISAMAMVSSVVIFPVQVLSGKLADLYSPLLTLAAFGGLLVVGSLAVLAWEAPVKTEGPASAERSD